MLYKYLYYIVQYLLLIVPTSMHITSPNMLLSLTNIITLILAWSMLYRGQREVVQATTKAVDNNQDTNKAIDIADAC